MKGRSQILPQIDPRARSSRACRFNRVCSIIGLSILLLLQMVKWVYYDRHNLVQTQDFDQYFMGGVMARHGAWSDLYPIPKPGALMNPGEFGNSILRPKCAELLAKYRAGDSTRYMQLPPLAVLFVPLTFLPFKQAHLIWIILLCFATWRIAHQTGRAYYLCSGRRDYIIGILMLLICVSPLAHRWIRVGNVSAMIGWLVGFIGLSIAEKRDGIGPAIAMVLGALGKYITPVLVPLHVAARQWRTLVWSAIIGVTFLLITLPITGMEPYRVFLNEIVPTLSRTVLNAHNVSLEGLLHRYGGFIELPAVTRICMRAVQIALLLVMLWGLFRRPASDWRQAPNVFAAATALVSWLLIFSPILWDHYLSVLVPFWGWMVWEVLRARGSMLIVIGCSVAAAIFPQLLSQKVIASFRFPEPINSLLLFATMLMMLLGMWRMFRREPLTAT